MNYLDGKKQAQQVQSRMKEFFSELKGKAKLHIVSFNEKEDLVTQQYLGIKKRVGKRIGVETMVHQLSPKISFDEVKDAIETIIEKNEPIIVQLPIPSSLPEQSVLNLIPHRLDVDVLSSEARELFAEGSLRFTPPVTAAIVEFIKAYHIDLKTNTIVVVGNGNLVGRPFAQWLRYRSVPFTLIHKETEHSQELLAQADIIVSGAGDPHFIEPHMVQDGVVLIDAGTSEQSGVVKGDVHPDTYTKASLVSPVPGGVGPLTISMLFMNVLKHYQ